MDSLQQLCGAAFSLHYVLLLAAANFPKPLFDHFVRQLESFLFYYIFTKTPTKDLERNFSVWADELREIGEIDRPEGAERTAERLHRRPVPEEHGRQGRRTCRRPEALHAWLHAAVPDALSAGQAHAARGDGVQGHERPGRSTNYTALEIEHILPDTPEANSGIFTAANPGKTTTTTRSGWAI